MSVFRRKTSHGETREYHYRFMKGGKLFFGVCEGCFDKADALAFESRLKKTASELVKQKSVKALVENFRSELAGGDKILLADAFRAAMSKPRRRGASEGFMRQKESRFRDFAQFMKDRHPDVKFVGDVTERHAEEYMIQLRTNGRHCKRVESCNGVSYSANLERLSPATLNRNLAELRSIFAALKKQCGMIENPFDGIPPVQETMETRDAFTESELEEILAKAPPFVKAIFIVGFFTAFREGDIATLRWSEVLWEQGVIRKKLLKTRHSSGAVVEVPILPPLAAFLRAQEGADAEYVLPEHAKMYRENPSGISYRVKKFLEKDLGIATTKRIAGRSRAASVKDVHSLRHTFCYFAGVAGVPLVVVQNIVGHMTPEMTAHYTAHADRDTKREKMAALPVFRSLLTETRQANTNAVEQKRRLLIRLLEAADEETLNRAGALLLPKSVQNVTTS